LTVLDCASTVGSYVSEDEKQTAAGIVTRLYQAVLDRGPTSAELTAASGKLVSGAESETQFAGDLLFGTDFANTFGPQTLSTLVSRGF
jgi:hypothetical protein